MKSAEWTRLAREIRARAAESAALHKLADALAAFRQMQLPTLESPFLDGSYDAASGLILQLRSASTELDAQIERLAAEQEAGENDAAVERHEAAMAEAADVCAA
jgi:hypothetical protein